MERSIPGDDLSINFRLVKNEAMLSANFLPFEIRPDERNATSSLLLNLSEPMTIADPNETADTVMARKDTPPERAAVSVPTGFRLV